MNERTIYLAEETLFRDREDAGRRLAAAFKGRALRNPLVLAIPRGGVPTGAVLARELGADLDVILARKLRAPGQPELAVGALAEHGGVYLNDYGRAYQQALASYLEGEGRHQRAEIVRRQKMFRGAKRPVGVHGRSVIVTDDGIATGSTMIAALQSLKLEHPYEVIVAVPVASPDRLEEVRGWCDDIVCLQAPEEFYAVGQFYEDFSQVEDEEVIRILGQFRRSPDK